MLKTRQTSEPFPFPWFIRQKPPTQPQATSARRPGRLPPWRPHPLSRQSPLQHYPQSPPLLLCQILAPNFRDSLLEQRPHWPPELLVWFCPQTSTTLSVPLPLPQHYPQSTLHSHCCVLASTSARDSLLDQRSGKPLKPQIGCPLLYSQCPPILSLILLPLLFAIPQSPTQAETPWQASYQKSGP